MFKKGDIVVRINNSYNPLYKPTLLSAGAIFKCLKYSNRAYYNHDSSIEQNNVRKATEDEIKWFKAGITNINQIPEVGGTFDFVDEDDASQNCKEIIKDISTAHNVIYCSTGNYALSDYVSWLKNNNVKNYKPPTKSTADRDQMFGTPFKPEDLKNCKIGNLTPEDHKIIQPFLFSLDYKWCNQGKTDIMQGLSEIHIRESYKLYKFSDYTTHTIKKETILNYIKQLNTNKNEIHRQNQEITRRPINGSARILSGRQQGSTGSRPKGNIQSIKGRETYFRRSEICGSVRLR